MSPRSAAATLDDALEIGRRPEIEDELTNKYHVGYTFHSGASTSRFDIEESLNNQARFQAIDETTVETYVEALQRGDRFPAVIAYRQRKGGKLVIIDGNHRLVSHDRVGAPLDVYEVEQGTRRQTIVMMTYAFNTKHGKGTSPAERIAHALYLLDNNATVREAAEAVNIPERDVKRAAARAAADRRADEVGLDRREWDSLGQSAKNRLLNITTDEGYKDATHLAFLAKLTADEIFELVSLLNSSKSATKQRALVKQKTAEYQDRIQASGGGQVGSANKRAMGPKQRVNMALGQVLALPDDVKAYASMWASPERKDAAGTIRSASLRLAALADALET